MSRHQMDCSAISWKFTKLIKQPMYLYYIIESLNVDEIIDFIRENHCLYDKRDMDFKNVNKKRDLWQKIFTNLRNCYDINMSGNFLFVKLLLFYIKIFCNLILLYQT